MTTNLILQGAPNSGKSTLAQKIIQESPRMRRFNVGGHFENEIKNNTNSGIRAKSHIEKQLWIPNELVIAAVRQGFLSGDFQDGVLFDGFPGDIEQARLLDHLVDSLDVKLIALIQLVVSDEICIERSMKRRVCRVCGDGSQPADRSPNFPNVCARCGNALSKRPDDMKGLFEERLKNYRYRMNDVLEYYRIKQRLPIVSVSGEAREEDVWRTVKCHIDAILA